MSLHGVLEGENHNHKITFVSSNIPPDTIQSILDTLQVSWRIKLFSIYWGKIHKMVDVLSCLSEKKKCKETANYRLLIREELQVSSFHQEVCSWALQISHHHFLSALDHPSCASLLLLLRWQPIPSRLFLLLCDSVRLMNNPSGWREEKTLFLKLKKPKTNKFPSHFPPLFNKNQLDHLYFTPQLKLIPVGIY